MDADDAVLLVLVNRPRDLEIIHSEHWYRIPVQHAPPHFAQARYLGFYLPACFGEARWSIREYALVRGHELVHRRDLLPDETDHPRADAAYYKIQLGAPLALPHPIVSRTSRRFLFAWTTGDKFSRAVGMDDLIVKNSAYRSPWELGAPAFTTERNLLLRDAPPRYRVDYWFGFKIPFHRGVTA